MTTTTSVSSTGAVATSGSTTYIESTASGLDTASLVSAAVATRTEPADALDAKVTANTNKISAYSQVQTYVNDLSTSIDALASASGLASGTTSAFANMQASLTSSSSSVTASDVMSATTTSSATAGSYTIAVNQLAQSMKVTGSSMSSTATIGEAGTFTLAASDGTASTISVTSGMTLSQVASAINAVSSTTQVDATLIQVSSGEYKLMLTSADTGQTITAKAASGSDVLTTMGITDSDGSFADTVQSAQSASLTVDGTTVTSTSNTVSDVVPGVTLNLTNTTASGDSITLAVTQDTSGVSSAVSSFITAYNTLHDYIESQETLGSDGSVASTSYLFADTTLRSLNSELNSLLTDPSASGATGASSAIDYLSQLGVTMTSSNDLQLSDASALSTALASNSSALQSFFQTAYSSSNSGLLLLSNDTTSSMSFTLDITADSSGVTGATVNGQSGLFTVQGNELVGVSGSAYAGLTFAIDATANTTADISLKQGFADSIVSLANQYGDTSSGTLEQQISSLTTEDTSLSAQSSSIKASASTYETSLINKYAAMETEISNAKTVQSELSAVLNGTSSSG